MDGYLSASRLAKQFGGTRVLDGVDFSLQQGECLVLLGPSGCGKTTLLNIIAGLIQADAGELHCDGQTLDAPQRGLCVPMRERRFSMVFQDFSLLRPRTRFAAEFIGSANLVPYRRLTGGLQLDERVDISSTQAPLGSLPERGHLVIRREAVQMVAPDTAPCQERISLSGVCQRRHFLGDRQEVVAEIHPGLTLRGFADQPFHPGAPVSVRISTDALHAVGE